MSAMQPVPADHPLMLAWAAHKQTDNYANSKRWAANEQHLDGSLWALFDAGWNAAMSAQHAAVPVQVSRSGGVTTLSFVREGEPVELSVTRTEYDARRERLELRFLFDLANYGASLQPADWLTRLKTERDEVAGRLAKLREFLAAPKGNPTPRQLTLLAKQERAMSDYVWAMDDRIADAEAPE